SVCTITCGSLMRRSGRNGRSSSAAVGAYNGAQLASSSRALVFVAGGHGGPLSFGARLCAFGKGESPSGPSDHADEGRETDAGIAGEADPLAFATSELGATDGCLSLGLGFRLNSPNRLPGAIGGEADRTPIIRGGRLR